MFGLLLLTKVQGILVPPLVVVWSLLQFRQHGVRPLAVWGLTAAVVFFVGWPWLWLDPFENVVTYLGRASKRPTLYVWYFGQRFADKAVPWHYPFVITAVTVPGIILLLSTARIVRRKFDRCEQLVLASIAWPLIVFALPGTPVYDGSRLFLVIMPAVAVLAGRAFLLQYEHTHGLRRGLIAAAVVVGLVIPASRCLSPFSLNYYGVVAGGQPGAYAAGFDSAYWVDGLNADFWKQVPEGATVYVAPVSHQFQLTDIERLNPIVTQRQIDLVAFEYDPDQQRGFVLLNHRLADLPPLLRGAPGGAPVVAEVRDHGVVLARLVDTTQHTWPERPSWPGE